MCAYAYMYVRVCVRRHLASSHADTLFVRHATISLGMSYGSITYLHMRTIHMYIVYIACMFVYVYVNGNLQICALFQRVFQSTTPPGLRLQCSLFFN